MCSGPFLGPELLLVTLFPANQALYVDLPPVDCVSGEVIDLCHADELQFVLFCSEPIHVVVTAPCNEVLFAGAEHRRDFGRAVLLPWVKDNMDTLISASAHLITFFFHDCDHGCPPYADENGRTASHVQIVTKVLNFSHFVNGGRWLI